MSKVGIATCQTDPLQKSAGSIAMVRMKPKCCVILVFLLTACMPTASSLPITATRTPTSLAVEFDGISFSYNPTLADSIITRTIPESDASQGDLLKSRKPKHTQFALAGYIPRYKQEFLSPEISVYSVVDYERVNPYFGQVLPDLVNLLIQKPSVITPTQKLRLPLLGDPQAQTRMQIAYTRFQNGSGVRFITYYREIFMPLTNSDLRYIFLGLTDDRKYYVSAVFPVSVPFLPQEQDSEIAAVPTYDPSGANYESHIAAIVAFNGQMEQKIEILGAEDFVPHLDLLDAMVQSLKIK